MAGAEDVQWQQDMRAWLQDMAVDPTVESSVLLDESWKIIEPAVHERAPDEVALLPEVSPLLTRVANVEVYHPNSMEERAKIDAGITLACWGLKSELAEGEALSDDSFTSCQQTLGAILAEMTDGTYLFQSDTVSRRAYRKLHEVLGIALVNRLRQPRHIMLPSPPTTHRDAVDEKGRSTAYNMVLLKNPNTKWRKAIEVLAIPSTDGLQPSIRDGHARVVPVGEVAKEAMGDETPWNGSLSHGPAFNKARVASTTLIARYVAMEADEAPLTDEERDALGRASQGVLNLVGK